MSLSDKIQSFPKTPGVYWMKDAKGEVLYVGKAKDLRNRVRAYFRKEASQRYQIDFLMRRTTDIEYLVTDNEKEALLLENKLIKKYKPRYNIDLKDDKSYASLKLNIRHSFPGLFITRNIIKDGSLYFGPYVSAGPLRQTLNLLTKYFKLRTCSDHEFANRSRPCLEYYIGHCSAPCVGKISQASYIEQIGEAKLFLEGREKELVRMLKEKMKKASEAQAYEEAARLRNLIFSVKETLEEQKAAAFEKKREDPLENRLLFNLQKKLGLVLLPAVIECVDISNFQGKEAVGSLVCFEGEKPLKNRYRKFKIRLTETPNDYAMMQEVLARRFGRAVRAETAEEKEKWEIPDLLLVDGGKGQLNIAKKVLADLGLHNLAVAAIAKAKPSRRRRREGEGLSDSTKSATLLRGPAKLGLDSALPLEGGKSKLCFDAQQNRQVLRSKMTRAPKIDKIYIPGRMNPVSLAPRSKELLYLMRIRDEAHRFVIAYHRFMRKRILRES